MTKVKFLILIIILHAENDKEYYCNLIKIVFLIHQYYWILFYRLYVFCFAKSKSYRKKIFNIQIILKWNCFDIHKYLINADTIIFITWFLSFLYISIKIKINRLKQIFEINVRISNFDYHEKFNSIVYKVHHSYKSVYRSKFSNLLII